jgi:arylsulfatase A-like enzyme
MMGEQDLRQVEGMYDEEVAYMDHQLGRVFDELRRLELWEDSLVVVVSDHGEEFQEHRSMEHGHNLYEETLHIPLLVKPPGGRPDGMRKRVSEHVGLVDVARSMLHMSALSIPPSFDGRSLVPLMRRRGEDRDVLASLDAAHWHMDALVHGHYKWILDEESDEQELYDLSTDPGETRSLVHTRLELAERMRALYKEAHARAHGSDEAEPGKVDLTEEEKDKLRALGYVQ